MILNNIKKILLTSGLGLAMLFGVAVAANAQDNRSYRDYQKQQDKIAKEQQKQIRKAQKNGVGVVNQGGGYWDANGYYHDYLGNVYDRNGTVVHSSGNRDPYAASGNVYNNNGYYNSGNYNNGPRYRVYRNGGYYSTDSRGAELLRQAVNNGYQQGYRQGQMDCRYGRNSSYYNNNMYRSGNYGYQGDVDSSQYQYYFQQGFQRGYQDGFNSTTRYGYQSGGNYNILGSILNSILNLTQN